jgi:histidyl-tRNA synthetase
VGIASPAIEAEMLALAGEAFEALGIDICCHVNHIDVLKNILTIAGVPEDQTAAAILSIDKLKKIGREGMADELAQKGIAGETVERIFDEFDALSGMDSAGRLDRLSKNLAGGPGEAGVGSIRDIFGFLSAQDSRLDIRFEPSLARGLQIYTGPVFEFFCRDAAEFEGAVAAGGRYDEIIGRFLHPEKPDKARDYPAVGLSFGLEPITIILDARAEKEREGRPRRTVTKVIIFPLGDTLEACLGVAGRLRRSGIAVEVDFVSRRAKKCFSWADRMGVPFVMVIGENEIAGGTFAVKHLASGEQRQLSLDDAASWIKE